MHNVQYGTGIPILILHGFCVDHRFLLGLDPTFAAEGQWRRVYIDLPGMGGSNAGPEIESADAVAKAVVEFARDTFQNGKFAVFGSSFGGMIARHLAAEFGEQILGLALLCPVAVAEPSDRALPPKTVLQADPELLESLDVEDARDYAETAVIQSPENWSRSAPQSYQDYGHLIRKQSVALLINTRSRLNRRRSQPPSRDLPLLSRDGKIAL